MSAKSFQQVLPKFHINFLKFDTDRGNACVDKLTILGICSVCMRGKYERKENQGRKQGGKPLFPCLDEGRKMEGKKNMGENVMWDPPHFSPTISLQDRRDLERKYQNFNAALAHPPASSFQFSRVLPLHRAAASSSHRTTSTPHSIKAVLTSSSSDCIFDQVSRAVVSFSQRTTSTPHSTEAVLISSFSDCIFDQVSSSRVIDLF